MDLVKIFIVNCLKMNREGFILLMNFFVELKITWKVFSTSENFHFESNNVEENIGR